MIGLLPPTRRLAEALVPKQSIAALAAAATRGSRAMPK